MIYQTHLFRSSFLAVLLCGASAVSLLAQGAGGPPPGGGPGGHRGPQSNRLFDALDTNHDGIISAEEMANASTSLKTLLKDGATELKREDLRPVPPAEAQASPQSANDSDQPHPRPKGVRPHHPPVDDQAAADAADRPHPPMNDDAARPHPQARAGGPADRQQHGPPPSPLFDALDTNHDGTISADEMASASTSLKTLLKSGSVELRREDLRPAHPPQRQEN